MERVLLTGAAGGIARRLRPMLRVAYPGLRLSDRTPPADLAPGEAFLAAELDDLAAVERAAAGMEGIVHLGGMSVESDWETILASNIIGMRNLYEAARRQGVERVVFASSNHVVGFHPRRRIVADVVVRPDSRYGVSKAFGEALGAFYADKYGLRVLAIRIGHVLEHPNDARDLSIWLDPDDLMQLVRIGLEHPALHYEVVYGVSDNERGWWENDAAFRLGYRPQGRAEAHREAALAGERGRLPDPLGDRFQGGSFVSAEFTGDPSRLLPGEPAAQ